MTWHDSFCEIETSRHQMCKECGAWAGIGQQHCHCGSRAFPLCVPCRSGQHIKHQPVDVTSGRACECDLEVAS
jgi:hypothetical protein